MTPPLSIVNANRLMGNMLDILSMGGAEVKNVTHTSSLGRIFIDSYMTPNANGTHLALKTTPSW